MSSLFPVIVLETADFLILFLDSRVSECTAMHKTLYFPIFLFFFFFYILFFFCFWRSFYSDNVYTNGFLYSFTQRAKEVIIHICMYSFLWYIYYIPHVGIYANL